jgi:hypothetical protein
LAQTLLHFFLRERSLLLRILESMTNLVEDLEVVLDVLKRTIFGQLLQKGFYLLLGVSHT